MQFIQEKAEPLGIMDVYEQQGFLRPSETIPTSKSSHSQKRTFSNNNTKGSSTSSSQFAFYPLKTKNSLHQLNSFSTQKEQLPGLFSSQRPSEQNLAKSHGPGAMSSTTTTGNFFRSPLPGQQPRFANHRIISNENNNHNEQTSQIGSSHSNYRRKQGLFQSQVHASSSSSMKERTNTGNGNTTTFLNPQWRGFDSVRLLQIDILPNVMKQQQQQLQQQQQSNNFMNNGNSSLFLFENPSQVNPYSLEASSQMLKEHFHTVIEPNNNADSKKKWVMRTVHPPKSKKAKDIEKSLLNFNPSNDFMVLESLKEPNYIEPQSIAQQQQQQLQQKQQEEQQQQFINASNAMMAPSMEMVNLNALMGSITTPDQVVYSSFLSMLQQQSSSDNGDVKQQQQQLNKKKRGFQIKKSAGTTNGQTVKKSTGDHLKQIKGQQQQQSRENLNNNIHVGSGSVVMRDRILQSQQLQAQEGEDPAKIQEHLEQSKMLPLFSLNFNKTLATRLLLNSIGVC